MGLNICKMKDYKITGLLDVGIGKIIAENGLIVKGLVNVSNPILSTVAFAEI